MIGKLEIANEHWQQRVAPHSQLPVVLTGSYQKDHVLCHCSTLLGLQKLSGSTPRCSTIELQLKAGMLHGPKSVKLLRKYRDEWL